MLSEPGEDVWIVAYCPVLPGCVSQGKTMDDAKRNMVRRELGFPDVEPMQEVEFAI